MKRPEFRRADETPTADDRRHTQWPAFDLEGQPDEPIHGNRDEVSSYTAYALPDEDENLTEWITADIGVVVPVEEIL